MLELFNVNNYSITVPKFNYEGRYLLPGKGFVEIEEDTADFFKPYSVIGAVVRKKVTKEEIKEEVEEVPVVQTVREDVEVETSPIVDDVPVAYPKIELEEDVVEEGIEEPEYTEESLRFKSLYELKEIADSMGIEVNTRKKEDIRKIILNNL